MKKNKTKIWVALILLMFVSGSIGYAALSTNLSISGSATVAKTGWNVHFENVRTDTNNTNVTPTKAVTLDSTTSVSYSVSLKKPGDVYTFYVDVVNDGTLDAKISQLTMGGVSTAQDVYIDYDLLEVAFDTDGSFLGATDVNVGDVIRAGATRTLQVSVAFASNVTTSQLPTTAQTLNLTLSMTFVQA